MKIDEILLLSGQCPHCENVLHYPASEASIECRHCNRYHLTSSNGQPQPYNDVLCRKLETLVFRSDKQQLPQNTTWSCQEEKTSFMSLVISPLLTYWGMDKQKVPQKLTKLGNPMEVLDCSKILGKRAALLPAEDANKIQEAYKCDYSDRLLQSINGESQVAVQVPVKGGGNGLFLAVSLALVGKEVFWHALQLNVFNELREKKEQYNSLLKEQQLLKDWDLIVRQCDPNYTGKADGKQKIQKIYLLALANVLKRPMILLDAQNEPTMSGVFLPVFHTVKSCVKGGLCLVWADQDRTHVEPLLGIKDRNPITVPADLIPQIWGVDQSKLKDYCDLKNKGGLLIKGKPLPEDYVSGLTEAMQNVFTQENGMSVNLLTDVYKCVYRTVGLLNIPLATMLQTTHQALDDKRLYRCLDCRNISIMPEAVLPNGPLYNHALEKSGQIETQKKYAFISLGYQCQYDEATDRLVAVKNICRVLECPWCEKKRIRRVDLDGEPILVNGDVTRAGGRWWNGDEYSADPKVIPIGLEWKGEVYPDTMYWFYDQEDASLNSTVDGTIDLLVQKHFPDETDTRVRERVARIVKLRLSQQQDLDIPGIEKYKEPKFKPLSIPVPDPDETTVMEPVTAEGAGVEVGGTPRVENGNDEPQAPGEDEEEDSDNDDSLYVPSAEGTEPTLPLSTTTSKEGGAVPKQKKVKVVHKGKTEILDLPYTLTFAELQKTLERQFGIPVDRQHIQHGYPLTLMTVSAEHLHTPYTQIQNNDKLILTEKASGGSMPKGSAKPRPKNPTSQVPTTRPQPTQTKPATSNSSQVPSQTNPTQPGTDTMGGRQAKPSEARPDLKARDKESNSATERGNAAVQVLLKLRQMLDDVNPSSGFTPGGLIQNVLENEATEDGMAGSIIADLLKESDVDVVTEAVTLWRKGIQDAKRSK